MDDLIVIKDIFNINKENIDLYLNDREKKIDLYNRLINLYETEIKNLKDKIEKLCLQIMENNMERENIGY